MATDTEMHHLPADPWLRILSFLDFHDIVSCSRVNVQLNQLSNHKSIWRKLCQKYWLVSTCPENISWKECFQLWYKDYGRYIHCYAKIKTAWNQITEFMKKNCLDIYKSINSGISEEMLLELEKKIGISFPDDLRCSYRIHNGQGTGAPSLLGSVKTPNHYRSGRLSDLQTVCRYGRSYLPLTFCSNCRVREYINISDNNLPKGSIFCLPKHDYFLDDINVFITARGFTEWLTSYAQNLSDGHYPIIDNEPLRFEPDPGCTRTTNHFKISVVTSFIPELSRTDPVTFVFSYRVTLTMSEDAPEEESCQLDRWTIMDQFIRELDIMDINDVYPVITPGSSFSWIYAVFFYTPTAEIQGYFNTINIKTGHPGRIKSPLIKFRSNSFVKTNVIQMLL